MKPKLYKYLPFLFVLLSLFFNPLSVGEAQGNRGPLSFTAIHPAQRIAACKNRVNIPDEEMHWLYVPQSASELHTEILYIFLAGQLISNGAVDASSCPAGGLTMDGSANACGLALTKPLVIQMQNAYDESILKAWADYSVPPVLLKQLFRYESQFWPGRFGKYHYGLGHVTFYGAHTALVRRPELLNQVCSVTGDCSTEISSPNFDALLNLMDAYCPSCQYKIDMAKAQASVGVIAQIVYSYCEQASQLAFNATGLVSTAIIDYPTLWKLTLMNYNAGPTCVFDAINAAYRKTDSAVTWADIEEVTDEDQCVRGVTYANQITEPFYDFPPK